MDNGRYFAIFSNVETKKQNVIYIEIEDGIMKTLAAISPEKNEDGMYELFADVNEKRPMRCFVSSIDDGKEAILEYYGE